MFLHNPIFHNEHRKKPEKLSSQCRSDNQQIKYSKVKMSILKAIKKDNNILAWLIKL